jgi:hypothetical protein
LPPKLSNKHSRTANKQTRQKDKNIQTFRILWRLFLIATEIRDHHLGDVERIHLVLAGERSHFGQEGEHCLEHEAVDLGHDQVKQLKNFDHKGRHVLTMFVQELGAANVEDGEVVWDDSLRKRAKPQLEEISTLKNIDAQ